MSMRLMVISVVSASLGASVGMWAYHNQWSPYKICEPCPVCLEKQADYEQVCRDLGDGMTACRWQHIRHRGKILGPVLSTPSVLTGKQVVRIHECWNAIVEETGPEHKSTGEGE